MSLESPPAAHRARARTYEVIFEHGTPAGRAFDVALILAILGSVAVVMLDSVRSIHDQHGTALQIAEWTFTLGFTIEYGLRLWSVRRAMTYARSFFGVVDLLSILPTWLSMVLPGGQALAVVRILRVIRVFRVLKLAQYVGEAGVLANALRASRYKITVFLVTVLSATVCVGSIMFLVEGPTNGFTSIPVGVYWAIVTLTTVGFGDLTPQTPLGQFLASIIMVLGYGIIAVPTGIVSAEIAWAARGGGGVSSESSATRCPECQRSAHDPDAVHCKWCGARLA